MNMCCQREINCYNVLKSAIIIGVDKLEPITLDNIHSPPPPPQKKKKKKKKINKVIATKYKIYPNDDPCMCYPMAFYWHGLTVIPACISNFLN